MNFGPSFLDFDNNNNKTEKKSPELSNSSSQQNHNKSLASNHFSENENDGYNSYGDNYDFAIDNFIQDPESFLNYQGVSYPQDDIDILINNSNTNQAESPNSPSSSIISKDPNYVYYSKSKLVVPMVNNIDSNGKPKRERSKSKNSKKEKNLEKSNDEKESSNETTENVVRKRGRPKYTPEQKRQARKERRLRKLGESKMREQNEQMISQKSKKESHNRLESNESTPNISNENQIDHQGQHFDRPAKEKFEKHFKVHEETEKNKLSVTNQSVKQEKPKDISKPHKHHRKEKHSKEISYMF